jgi:protein ImuA
MSAVPAPASRRIASAPALERLQSGGALWRGHQLAASPLPACASGFAELDAELPGGGWPAAGLTELLLRDAGSGELRLLAPALAKLAVEPRELVWVAPPFPPYAPALHALGLPLERIVWLAPAGEADAAWAAEQVLRASAGAVLWWSREALPATLRRLHLAAQEGATPLFAFRPLAKQKQSSPAPLRLALEPVAGGLSVDVFKRRGPALAKPVMVPLGMPVRVASPRSPQPSPASGRGREVSDVVAGAASAVAAA